MRLEIKKMRLENFRGFTHQEVEFDGNTKVLGANAQGKTTLFFAWMWLMSDKSDSLISNPNITPMGMNECVSKVEAEVTIDEKPCTITKSQKYKEKTDDSGKVTSGITNSFTINGVEKTATSFKADLVQRGIDMDNFLILSHVFAFTADTSKKGREEMRKVLFEMVDGITDMDIAKELKSDDIIALLEKGYKIDEIEQMNKGSLKNLNARYGANNELIDARIQGIMDSKSQTDVKSIEAQKAAYESELEQVRSDFNNLMQTDKKTESKIAELEGKCIEIERSSQKKIDADLASASEKLRNQEHLRNDLEIDMINKKHEMDRLLADKEGIADSLENYRNLYKKVQDEVFDESSLKCPCCGRKYSADKADKMKQTFEDSKTKRLNDYKSRGETFAKQLEAIQEKYDVAKLNWEEADKEWHKADDKAQNFAEELSIIPRKPNLAESKEYQAVRAEIESLRESLSRNDDSKLQELSNRESYLISMIKQAIAEIAVSDRNKELDEQISVLRKEKKDAEIKRSEHEKIIYEVEKFKKAKNDKLSDMVNSHFHIAQFRLFKILKNGSIEDDCSILVNGKEFNSQLNQSTQILALTDVISGLQSFKEQYLPVFLDNHALFTSESDNKIPLECQVIKLIAAEDKKLTVERG